MKLLLLCGIKTPPIKLSNGSFCGSLSQTTSEQKYEVKKVAADEKISFFVGYFFNKIV